MDKAAVFEWVDGGFDPHYRRLFLIQSSIVHCCYITTEANAKLWTIGIHGLVLF